MSQVSDLIKDTLKKYKQDKKIGMLPLIGSLKNLELLFLIKALKKE